MRLFTRTMIIALIAMFSHNILSAQWVLGEPFSMQVSTLTMYSLDVCPPTPTHTFWFPVSEAAGINHIAIVQTLDTPDIVEIGLGNEVEVGDTIPITDTDPIAVYFYAGSGSMTLNFYATGTPTQAGDPVPCDPNDLWINTLPICNISNNPLFTVGGDCFVVDPKPSLITDLESVGISVNWPVAANGYQLYILSQNELIRADVHDLSGRLVAQRASNIIACQELTDGVYIFSVQVGDAVITRSFALTR